MAVLKGSLKSFSFNLKCSPSSRRPRKTEKGKFSIVKFNENHMMLWMDGEKKGARAMCFNSLQSINLKARFHFALTFI
jgi:hypothetical protein